MTINDQINDEKLHYNIHREAAKTSALSSGKIHKYKYLTGKDILPSNKQQIIEQAEFTSSPLGKAFENQINKKQTDALENLELKAIESGSNNNKTVITQEIYEKILEERMGEILKMRDKADYGKLIYDFKGLTLPIDFAKFEGPIYIYGNIKYGKTTLQQVEKQQKDF